MLSKIIRKTELQLFNRLTRRYENAIHEAIKYILVPGEAPVLLVAHLDTVHKEKVETICRSSKIWMSPQGIGGDDRCGVYALVSIHEKAKKKPWLLFTCGEESGGIGASRFVNEYLKNEGLRKRMSSIKFIIELDRKGKNDAVYYSCYCPELEDYITSKGFHTDIGSYSDIVDIAPVLGVAAVNLSCGYYNAHTQHEYIVIPELENTIKVVTEIVNEACELPCFPYKEDWRLDETQDCFIPTQDEQKMLDELSVYMGKDVLMEYVAYYGREIIQELYEEVKEEESWVADV